MYILFILLTVLLFAAEVFSVIKTHRIWQFLLVSVIVLAVAIALDFGVGLLGSEITDDFYFAAFFWQLFPFITAGVWFFATVTGVVAMFIKEPRYTFKMGITSLVVVVAVIACGICGYKIVRGLQNSKELADTSKYPAVATSGIDFYGNKYKTGTVVVSDRENKKENVVSDLYLEGLSYAGDGKFVGVVDERDDERMVLVDMNSGQEQTLFTASVNGMEHMEHPVFSEDGKSLYFIADYRNIRQYDLDSGKMSFVLYGEKKLWLGKFALTPDEKKIYYFNRLDEDHLGELSEKEKEIWVYDLETETKTQLLKEDDQINGLDLSKDGKTLYYVCDRTLTKMDLETGESTSDLGGGELQLSGAPGEWPVRVSEDGRYVLLSTTERSEEMYKVIYRAYAYDTQENKVVEVLKSQYDINFMTWVED